MFDCDTDFSQTRTTDVEPTIPVISTTKGFVTINNSAPTTELRVYSQRKFKQDTDLSLTPVVLSSEAGMASSNTPSFPLILVVHEPIIESDLNKHIALRKRVRE